MNPFLTLAIGAVAVGAWPTWRVMRRQRRSHGTHQSHLPGHRQPTRNRGAEVGEAANAAHEIREFGGL